MPNILVNPNTVPTRADLGVHADASLDLANFVGQILPSSDPVLVSLGGNLKEYQKLRRDDQVAALMQQRQDKLVEAEYEVVPGGEDARDVAAADFLREQLAAIQFDQASRKMHGSILYGYGIAECIWGRDARHVTLTDIKVRAPWRFGFAKDGLLKLIIQSEYRPMPPRKFWHVTWGAEDDDSPYGTGLGHALWWPVYLKRNGARFWAAFLDRFGVPTTKATYQTGSSDSETERRKRTALEAAMALRSEGAVALPEGFDISLVEATGGGNGAADFKSFLSYWDDAIAKIILSQTGTSRLGQYSGAAEVHSGVSTSVVKADADLLCQSFNVGPAIWLTEWNFPGAKPPKVWRKVEDATKVTAEGERDKNIAALGLELTDEEIKRRHGDGWQRKRADAAPAFAESSQKTVTGADAAPPEPYSQTLSAQAQALSDGAHTSMIDSLRAELDAAVARGDDLANFAERMMTLNKLQGVDDLAALLSDALLTADLAGRAGEE